MFPMPPALREAKPASAWCHHEGFTWAIGPSWNGTCQPKTINRWTNSKTAKEGMASNSKGENLNIHLRGRWTIWTIAIYCYARQLAIHHPHGWWRVEGTAAASWRQLDICFSYSQLYHLYISLPSLPSFGWNRMKQCLALAWYWCPPCSVPEPSTQSMSFVDRAGDVAGDESQKTITLRHVDTHLDRISHGFRT